MDRLLYVSAVGLANIERAQTARANNLANVSTTGFRADLARVSSSEVSGEGYRTRVYGVNEGAGVDFSRGVNVATDRNLDVAVNGDGLLAVLQADGTEAYTRNGRLQIDSLGQLTTANGMPVVGLDGPIVLPPFETVVIAKDGGITIRPQGQGPEALVQTAQLKLVNPPAGDVSKAATGLLVANNGLPFEAAENVEVEAGFLESSNVNAVNELTEILSLARQFELEVRMMKVAETTDEAATSLLRVG